MLAMEKFSNFRYVETKADRVTVIFSTIFRDPDDVVIGKLFLQVRFYSWSFKIVSFSWIYSYSFENRIHSAFDGNGFQKN